MGGHGSVGCEYKCLAHACMSPRARFSWSVVVAFVFFSYYLRFLGCFRISYSHVIVVSIDSRVPPFFCTLYHLGFFLFVHPKGSVSAHTGSRFSFVIVVSIYSRVPPCFCTLKVLGFVPLVRLLRRSAMFLHALL